MIERIRTALVLLGIVSIALLLGPPVSVILGLVIYGAMQIEYARFAIRVRPAYQHAYVALTFVLPVGLLLGGVAWYMLLFVSSAVIALSAVVLVAEREENSIPLEHVLFSVTLGLLYVTGIGALLPYALQQFSLALSVWTLLIIATCDSAAYFGGRYFQGKKLAPRISPKKTLAGFLCGCSASMVAGTLSGWYFFEQTPLAVLIPTSAILSVSGVFGDLVESAIKRSFQVKDSGTLLPGHGGVLDRVDALIFAVPPMLIILQHTTSFH